MTTRGGQVAAGVTLEALLLEKAVEQFLLDEADALDERRFDDWLDFLAEDIQYWMPMRRNVKFGEWELEDTRAGEEVCWFDESKRTLTQRVRQLQTGTHWAEEPVSRICHVISAVRIKEISPDLTAPAEVRVMSRFIVYRNREEIETDFFVGRRHDLLRYSDGQWRVAKRCILLDQNVLLAKNMTMFF